jgi:hypothetical protein
MFEYNWAYSHITEKGVIASDDITWNSAFKDFKRAHPDLNPVIKGLGYLHLFELWRSKSIKI